MAGRYDWTRFVCAPTDSYTVDSEGFLNDPDKAGKYAKDLQPALKTVNDVESLQIVVILGEPGIGKSDLLGSLRSFRQENLDPDSIVLYRNLNSYSSESYFVADVFQTDEVKNWKDQSKKTLFLYLDSLDECLLRIDTISQLIAEQLSRLPTSRLKLRLSCRTGVWPQYLESALKNIFNDEGPSLFEVAPLREVDVEIACKAEGIDSEKFLQEVSDKGVTAFAIKPVTLRFLIKTFQKNQKLPADQKALYLDGCKQLCDEFNPSRKAKTKPEATSADAKFKIACRIACLSILTNKNTVWLGSEYDRGPNDLTISDIVGGSLSKEGDLNLSEIMVRETLDSGLFTSRGSERMGWAHQTYAEYLAAVYLSSNNFSIEQLSSLFFSSNPDNPKLIPQLSQAAAFLAAQREDFLSLLIEKDPEILLKNDNSSLPDTFKQRVIQSIFEQVKNGNSFANFELEIRRRFKGLVHPNIADQIRPVINDKTLPGILRRLGVDIAETCNISDLSEEILTQALDSSDEYYVRVNAANAAGYLLPEEKKKEMVRLLETTEADPDDELKGYALSTLWPNHISVQEMFNHLTAPKNEHFFGAYAFFLTNDLTDDISEEDLPAALEWAALHIENQPSHSRFGQTVDRIIAHAWKHIERPNVLGPFARVAYKKLIEHEPIFSKFDSKEFASAVEQRREIFLSILEQIPHEEIEPYFIFSSSSRLLNNDDFMWLMDLADKEVNPQKQKILVEIIRFFVDWANTEQSDIVIKFAQKHPVAAEYFKWHIGPIELGSEDAKEMKRRYEQEQSWTEKRTKKKENWPKKILSFITKALAEVEKGNQAYFAQLVRYLCVDLENGQWKDENQISEAGAWDLLDSDTKNRIVIAAKSYLNSFDPEIESYLESNSLQYSVWAGTKALRLLAELDVKYVNTQDQIFWERWTPSLIAYPLFQDRENENHIKLLQIANSKAQSLYEQTIVKLAKKEGLAHGSIFIIRQHEKFITPNLLESLLKEAKEFPPKAAVSILGELASFGVREAEVLLSSYISTPLPSNADAKTLTLEAVSNLMSHGHDAGWSLLWPFFQKDKQFGREVILHNGLRNSGSSFFQKLSDEQIGDFYSWMIVEFPHSNDRRGGGWVGPDERAADLRNAAIKNLVDRGTRKSCEIIKALVKRHSNLPILRWHLIEAEKRNRWLEWNPPTPSNLLEMSSSTSKILVNSEEELVSAIMNSLRRFNTVLHDTTPALTDLWNTEKDRFRPKTENEISDRIKRHLDEDLKEKGIIVNREVEIRKSVGTGTGQRTDIQVDAAGPLKNGTRDRLTVIVEVKGCWHLEVLTAAETQLGNRYLKDNSTRHGIYLVADCLCEKWDSEDHRKANSARNNIAEKYAEIERQSEILAENGYAVSIFRLNCKFRT